MAQEILGTFAEEIGQVTLQPSCEAGFFQIHVVGDLLWCRKVDGGFPDVKALKQRIRDRIAPERDLGHVDK
jgi:selenoprotein W-related protein